MARFPGVHPFEQATQPGNKTSSFWRRWLSSLLVMVFSLTLLAQPAWAESTGCNVVFGWWESPGLQPVFTTTAPTTDCDFQQWSWSAFVHYMQKTGPQDQPLFLSLRTSQDLERLASASEETPTTSPSSSPPAELLLAPRFQKPGLAVRGRQDDELDSINQAGSNGILVDQDSRVVYYSIHVNDDYFDFAKSHMGNKNYRKTSPATTFPVNATVVKAAWRVIDAGSELPAGTFTTKATLQLLEKDPDHKGQLRPSEQTKSGVTVALVGAHVVGVVENHPEFIWATFEQKNNTPNLPPGTTPASGSPVSDQNFSFYKAGTTAANSNQLPAAYSLNPKTQQVKPQTNIFRQFAHGGAEFSAESEKVSGLCRVADIDSMNANFQAAIPEHSAKIDPVFANYNLIGSLWIDTKQAPLKPGLDLFANSVGSIALASSTMESFAQGIGTNCFSCHTTQPFATKSEFADKNIAISHIISGSLTQTPTQQ
jgi:hypothetical protein